MKISSHLQVYMWADSIAEKAVYMLLQEEQPSDFFPCYLNFPDSLTGQSLIALLNVIVHFFERHGKYSNYFWIRAIYFPRSGSCWRINGHFSEKYSVSPLCQRVSPFETLHVLYLLGLCQRVNLFQKKLKIWIFFLRRVREIFRRPSSFFSIASQWIFCALGSKSKFLSNYLELSKLFLIFALSFGEMDDDIEESY